MFIHVLFSDILQEISLGTKEIRDLTRIERIGAHSHVRGMFLRKFIPIDP